jgi:succinoglycan biosynthesis transport protein ExoP
MDDHEDRAPQSSLTPGRLLVIARRRWWIVLACFVLGGGGAFAFVTQRPPSYDATDVVAVQALPTVLGAATPGAIPGPDPAVEVHVSTVVAAATRAAGRPVRLEATLAAGTPTITVKATASSAAGAAAAAKAAASALVADRTAAIQALASSLDAHIAALGAQEITLSATAKTNSFNATKLAVVQGELQISYTLQQNYEVSAAAVQLATNVLPVAQPAGISRKKATEIGLLVGLLIGCALALISDHLDDRLRSSSELAEIGAVTLLAELPTRPRVNGRRTLLSATSNDELSEAVRQLRTALRFLSVEKPLRTLLVTSAAPGEGKSFVAANLAVALAVSGTRTILVSSDLRRPRLETLLESAPSSHGLSEAIAQAALTAYSATNTRNGDGPLPADTPMDLEGLLVMTGVENLLLLPAGVAPPNPAELLGSSHMGSLVDALKAVSDIVIMDSPPVLAVTDALVLTAHADGVLLVISKGKTSRSAARRALRQLESGLAPVLGVALNRSSPPDVTPYTRDAKPVPGPARGRRSRSSSGPEPLVTPAARTEPVRGAQQAQHTP